MASYSDTITFGGETIHVISLTAIKKQKQRKMVVGKKLHFINVIGVNEEQWEIRINAVITGNSLSDVYANRDAIEALNDLSYHAYVDGLHDGNYYMVPDSLVFEDTGERGNLSFKVSFKLVEV